MTLEQIDIWEENISKLKAYHKKYGNYNVPLRWNEDRQFSQWVDNIRKQANRIPKELRKRLEKIKFNFTAPANDWDAMFSRLEAFYQKYGSSYVPPFKFEKLFDWTVSQRRAKPYLTRVQIDKLNSLNFEWETLTDRDLRWQSKYQELLKFKADNGHVRVPQYFKENKALGDWVSKQRRKKTEGTLSKTRIKNLNNIGFLWKEDLAKIREQAWDDRYNELVHYKKINKHIDRIKVTNENYNLGLWMTTQIVRQDKLSPLRKKKLNAIGFRWEMGDIYEERWNEMYNKLKAYKAKHGHCRVKQKENFKLSVWLQRNKRDKKQIGKDKVKKLEQLGVKWPYELFEELWELRYQELKAFKKDHGHLRISRSNNKLHEWVEGQKKLKEEGTLTSERIDKLKKLGFVWRGEAQKHKIALWEVNYKKFKAFKELHGSKYHLKLKKHPELDEWVRLQIHSKEKLSAYKREKLNAINFLWNRSKYYVNERWEEMYNDLVAYKKKFGNCDVPQGSSEYKTLAHWVNGQRTKTISAYRRNKLAKIGFLWAHELLEKRWQQRLKEFVSSKKKGAKIVHHTPLFNWIYQQRKNFRTLPIEKKKMLIKAGIIEVKKSK